jgi:soluble lytic murein transglycosylase-like protein
MRGKSALALGLILGMLLCGKGVVAEEVPSKLDVLIRHHAAIYDLPESLVRRLIKRESNFNPNARNGPYWGLLQIHHRTAKSMGYKGPAKGLLDAATNLQYGLKYLAGAYRVAGGNHDKAIRYYASGYYYAAKRKGLLKQVGLQ